AECFYHLVRLGVPFPHDKYGGYVGYKTDNDAMQRASSSGPWTSRMMVKALGDEVKLRDITVLEGHQVVELLVKTKGSQKEVCGALALNLETLEGPGRGFVVFNAVNVILATGGPAGMYKASVYPANQTGSTGLGLKIGAVAHNLTESQFGLASVKLRWNVSGSYQQVIPRYISTNSMGKDQREFLSDFFPNTKKLVNAIFLKGYQWPFDARKTLNYGSSLIDLLVYRESAINGRRVYLDFTKNPKGFSFELLTKEAMSYLERCNAVANTPQGRLARLNQPAAALYHGRGIDLSKEPLEIAVCAQHSNGGLVGNIWWESNIKHLFPVGEINGSHGVYRPGGAALNAGQVGAFRAAKYISKRYNQAPPTTVEFNAEQSETLQEHIKFGRQLIEKNADSTQLNRQLNTIRRMMSSHGAIVRSEEKAQQIAQRAWSQFNDLTQKFAVPSAEHLPAAYKLLNQSLTAAVYLKAIAEYIGRGGRSHGSFLVLDQRTDKPYKDLEDSWRFDLNDERDFGDTHILEIWLENLTEVKTRWVKPRPVPKEDGWFEEVWKNYREDKIIE
ncbi:FAD-binding protein, partial [bacterium]|nr:FAD-binding protein [bacterium]